MVNMLLIGVWLLIVILFKTVSTVYALVDRGDALSFTLIANEPDDISELSGKLRVTLLIELLENVNANVYVVRLFMMMLSALTVNE